MIIQQLTLQNFRNYSQKELYFSPDGTLLVGPNAAGKTNILEAIYLLATGKSPRVGIEEEMIYENKELARINGKVVDEGDRTVRLEIVLTGGMVGGKNTAKKRYVLNDVPRRMTGFIGMLKAVLFRPEDMEIVLGTPSCRRDFLNNVLTQVDDDYRRSLLTYKKGLKQRNRILQKIRDNETDARQLYFWDELLIKNGDILTRKREELIGFLNNYQTDKDLIVDLVYEHSVISRQRLDQYYHASVAAGMTLVGPHRDDFIITMLKAPIRHPSAPLRTRAQGGQSSKPKTGEQNKTYNLAYYGSRGEQRLAVLSLKLSELAFIRKKCSEKPVLLLDDIFSELDENHRRLVFQAVKGHQTIMTATETDWLPKKILDTMEVVKIT